MKTKSKLVITLIVFAVLIGASYGYLVEQAEPAPVYKVTIHAAFNHRNYSGHSNLVLWANASCNRKVSFIQYPGDGYGDGGSVLMGFIGSNWTAANKNLTIIKEKTDNYTLCIGGCIWIVYSFSIPMTVSSEKPDNSTSVNIQSLSPLKCTSIPMPSGYYTFIGFSSAGCKFSNGSGYMVYKFNTYYIYLNFGA